VSGSSGIAAGSEASSPAAESPPGMCAPWSSASRTGWSNHASTCNRSARRGHLSLKGRRKAGEPEPCAGRCQLGDPSSTPCGSGVGPVQSWPSALWRASRAGGLVDRPDIGPCQEDSPGCSEEGGIGVPGPFQDSEAASRWKAFPPCELTGCECGICAPRVRRNAPAGGAYLTTVVYPRPFVQAIKPGPCAWRPRSAAAWSDSAPRFPFRVRSRPIPGLIGFARQAALLMGRALPDPAQARGGGPSTGQAEPLRPGAVVPLQALREGVFRLADSASKASSFPQF